MKRQAVRKEINKGLMIFYAAAVVIFIAGVMLASPERTHPSGAADYVEYELGKVETVLADSCETDPASDYALRGEQLLIVKVETGRYEGESMQVYNYVSPLFGGKLKAGDRVSLTVSTYSDGTHRATVYEYDRIPALIFAVLLFAAATVLVGGKTGVRSLLGLVFTVLCLLKILLPGLVKGAPTVLLTFAVCSYITAVSMVILNGLSKKTLCASLGTIAGMTLALMFALLAQKLARIDGLRVSETEPLLQLRQSGSPIRLRGLLSAGIIVSSLGAVMDVAMSLSSALYEVHSVDKKLGRKELFRSGMNIGRDMVGTMTNTLILAFLGSSFVLILYLYTLGLPVYQLGTSSYLATELISGISGSIGIILSVPLTAMICSFLYAEEDSTAANRRNA